MTITDYGKQAIAAAMAGQTTITITGLKSASSPLVVPEGDYDELSLIVQEVAPSALYIDKQTNTAVVTGMFNNDDLEAAYTIRVVGIYAKCAGEYNVPTPHLFAYELISPGDFMPLPTTPMSLTYEFNTKVSGAMALNIEIVEGSYALASDFANLQDTVSRNAPKAMIVRLNNTTASTEKEGFSWLQEVAAPGVTPDTWLHSEISSGSLPAPYVIEPAENKLRLWFHIKPSTTTYINIVYMPTHN